VNSTHHVRHGLAGCSSIECGNGGSSSTSSGSPPAPPVAAVDPDMRLGVCKWFNVLKGFGFITPDDGSDEVFVHQSVVKKDGFRSIEAGAVVEFKASRTQRGMEATYCGGPANTEVTGSSVHPLGKKKNQQLRCFNCGRYANHVAAKCPVGPIDKCCYHCRGTDHLFANCPNKTPAVVASPQVDEVEPTA